LAYPAIKLGKDLKTKEPYLENMRKTIIAANWKMNKTSQESISFVKTLKKLIKSDVEIVICPMFTALEAVSKELKGTKIKLGAQNCYFEEKGAFTGEVSPVILKDIGCEYVILGHSERRKYFKETDDLINKKIKKALSCGLKSIVCVGELLEERENGMTNKVIEKQIKECLNGLTDKDMAGVVIAYEPVWAIGTGKNATPIQAEESHLFMRELIAKMFNKDIAKIEIDVEMWVQDGLKPEIATKKKKLLFKMVKIRDKYVKNYQSQLTLEALKDENRT